jgi:hypothetical protein
MNRTLRKLLVPGVGVVLAGTGFAYMSSGGGTPTYSSVSTVTVNGYDVYRVTTESDAGPNIRFIDFKTIPNDGDHSVNSWPGSGQVEANGTWYNCTSAWNGNDSRTSNYTETIAMLQSNDQGGSPQASWVCDLSPNTIAPAAWQGVNSLNFLIQG